MDMDGGNGRHNNQRLAPLGYRALVLRRFLKRQHSPPFCVVFLKRQNDINAAQLELPLRGEINFRISVAYLIA
jgi:hypothetical protein